MSVPHLFNAFYMFLVACSTPLALFCFVVAGFQLRNEGGVNYASNGGFFRWILWGVILLTISSIQLWLVNEGFAAAAPALGGASAPYTDLVEKAVTDFVMNVVRDRIVPVVAGALVLKSLLDAGEGNSPFPSIISALFLLGIGGFFIQVEGWNDASAYATADVLKSMLNWAMTSVAPVLGAMAIYGGIVQFVRRQAWVVYAFVGAGFLALPAIWSLVQSWAGVTLP